jgi:hypothetical protein
MKITLFIKLLTDTINHKEPKSKEWKMQSCTHLYADRQINKVPTINRM